MFPRRQKGVATLFIAIALLAILTVVAIFAVNVGYFEQKSSANDYRQKLAFQAAEAGLNQAVEFLKANSAEIVSGGANGWLAAGSERWQPCDSPVPTGVAFDPCTAEVDAGRRSRMFRYVGTTNGILPLAEDLPGGVSQTFTSTGGASELGADGFSAEYRAYGTLCRLDVSSGVPRCSLAPSEEGTFFVTVVSEGQLPDENASARLKQSYAAFRLLGRQPDAPLIAAGAVNAGGSMELVPNPNAAGFGAPVSIWAKGNADVANNAINTCHLGEWLGSSTGALTTLESQNGVCATCSCEGLRRGFGLISGKETTTGTIRVEGIDVLDVEGAGGDVNVDGAKDSTYFPPDLFDYVFGVPDTAADPAATPPVASGAETYLTLNATQISDCKAQLDAASAGLFWYTGNAADCEIVNSVGTIEEPVVLVSDSPVSLAAGGRFFGILYIRDVSGSTELLKAAGGPEVYGSVILEGSSKIAGGPSIIFNKTALQNIYNSPRFMRFGAVPGSWSDSVR